MYSIFTQVTKPVRDTKREPGLPVAYAGLQDHQRLDLYRDS